MDKKVKRHLLKVIDKKELNKYLVDYINPKNYNFTKKELQELQEWTLKEDKQELIKRVINDLYQESGKKAFRLYLMNNANHDLLDIISELSQKDIYLNIDLYHELLKIYLKEGDRLG